MFSKRRGHHLTTLDQPVLVRRIISHRVVDGTDVLPVTLENMRADAVGLDGARDDVLAEIGKRVVQQRVDDELPRPRHRPWTP